jgi:hypothetical protein
MKNPWALIEKPNQDLNVRLADCNHPLRLYWGVDVGGEYLFIYEGLLEHLPEQKSLPKLSGIRTAVAEDRGRGKLLFSLNETVNWEIFHALCYDIIRATSQIIDGIEAPVIILRRLKRWQELLKKERRVILSIEEIKGLLGELLFLSGPVAKTFGWDDAISFWKGPEEAPQDFAVHQDAIEVKCQSGGSKPSVRISSLEQLNPQLPGGYLVVYTLATANGEESDHFNLNYIVDKIRNELLVSADITRERFEDLLYLSGYVTNEKYFEYIFSKVVVKSFKIEGDFPRIIPNAITSGISSISYSVQLDACTPFEGKPSWWKIES